jgi:hypothetical protein
LLIDEIGDGCLTDEEEEDDADREEDGVVEDELDALPPVLFRPVRLWC